MVHTSKLSSPARAENRWLVTIKWALIACFLAGAMGGFYVLQGGPWRYLALSGGLGAALGLFFWTQTSRQVISLMRGAREEAQKVVWPTRQETWQGTVAVTLMVTVVAVILWLEDMLLAWVIRFLLGSGE